MTTSPLEKEYFHWLVMQIEIEKSRWDYEDVLELMYNTEFVWVVMGDDNRLQDGLDLRHEFRPGWEPSRMCSVLEVLIGLSRRMAWTMGGEPSGWAWQFLLNIGLEKYHDPLTQRRADRVAGILETLVYRNYNPDGSGGFFPLQDPDEDQTQVEIWYQMSAYIGEILPD